MQKPCITETRRVFSNGTFRWNHKTYQATNLELPVRWTRYGIGVRDDGSVYLRNGHTFVSDAVEVLPPVPSLTQRPTCETVVIPRIFKVAIQ